jgi:hypothetical protein
MEEIALHSLNIYVFDFGIQSKIGTGCAMETVKVSGK